MLQVTVRLQESELLDTESTVSLTGDTGSEEGKRCETF